MPRTTLQGLMLELDERCLIVASNGVLESIERSGRFLVVTLREGNFDLRVVVDLKFGRLFSFCITVPRDTRAKSYTFCRFVCTTKGALHEA